ncbi:hypothetical protein JCM12298_07530 [Desulfothermus naphthae]
MKEMDNYQSNIEVQRKGYQILAKELGVVNFIRFIQEFEKGSGNYTEERHNWQDVYSVQDILEEIKNKKL